MTSANKAARRKRHARTCVGKVRHDTRQNALTALISLCLERGVRLNAMQVYRCSACSDWHHGHKIGGRR